VVGRRDDESDLAPVLIGRRGVARARRRAKARMADTRDPGGRVSGVGVASAAQDVSRRS
jgi:hypothetical protein